MSAASLLPAPAILAEGKLCKQGHANFLNWQDRYCLLTEGKFKYFTDETKKHCKGTYCITTTSTIREIPKKANTIELSAMRVGLSPFDWLPEKIVLQCADVAIANYW